MRAIRWIVIALALLDFTYMTVDGARALIVGDYFRPSSGEYAGRLGPWSTVVSDLGIDPEGTPMKSFFVLCGVVGLAVTVAFALVRVGPGAMLLASLLSVWNLYLGTIISVVMILLLTVLILRSRSQPVQS